LDINALTPIEALLKLQAIQGILNEKIWLETVVTAQRR
jgi:hypothetical protein